MFADPAMPLFHHGPQYDGLKRIWAKYRLPTARGTAPTASVGQELDPGRGSVPPMANEGRSGAIGPVPEPVDETRKWGRS